MTEANGRDKMIRPTVLALSALILASCAPVGPDYHKPQTEAPADWTQARGASATTQPAAADYARWWRLFNDPVLTDLIAKAIEGNKNLAIAKSRVAEARASRRSSLSVLFPELNVGGSYARTRSSENTIAGPQGGGQDHDNFRAGFDANWELDIFGGGRRGLEAADADLQALKANLRDVTVTLAGEVATNYVELRGFQRRLEIARKNIDVQKSNLELSAARVKAGLRSELDVSQAQSLLATSRATLPTLEAASQQSMHRLSVLLGNNPSALNAMLTESKPIPVVPPEVPAGLPSELLQRRPDIHRAERELAAATARIGLATAELFPRVSITGSTGLESIGVSDFFTGGSRYWSIGPTVRWPILTFGRIRANIDVKNEQQVQAARRYEQTILTAFEEVENALVALGKEREHRAALIEAVEANRRSVTLSTELYTKGIGDFLAVLDAQRSLFVIEDELVRSERSSAVAMVALYKALGGGWSPDEKDIRMSSKGHESTN